MIKNLLTFIYEIFMSYLAMKDTTDTEDKATVYKLGMVAVKYEGGSFDTAIISNIPDDPGGKSYGPFQFSLNAGTLKTFIDQSRFRVLFEGMEIGSDAFDKQWIALTEDDSGTFLADQHDFAITKFFNPAFQYAILQGFCRDSLAIQEAIFSMALQHGGYRRIIKLAKQRLRERSVPAQIAALYDARKVYVMGLHSLSPLLKKAITQRYDREILDIFEVYEEYDK